MLERACAGGLGEVQKELSESYLGYVVIRPMECAPVGRTLVATYGEADKRCYAPVIRACKVHLFGIDVEFDALPFIQQDQGVGACATAALWSGLAKSCREVGMRAPTPHSVTSAAIRNYLTDRPVPAAAGLELAQMAEAIRGHGFSPYTVKVAEQPELFLATVMTYVRSGIPAILFLRSPTGGHAVAVAGFKETTEQCISLGNVTGVVRTPGIGSLYIHDDRIGPYVKSSLKVLTIDGFRQVQLTRVPVDDPKDVEFTRDTFVSYGLFPLYPKLRLSAPDLIEVIGKIAPFFRLLLGAPADELIASTWFAQNGAYLKELFESGSTTISARKAEFVSNLKLSRYVGIIRWSLHGEPIADVVCDTTDIRRENPPYREVLGFFFYSDEYGRAAAEQLKPMMPHAVVV